jgi:hypothetical protein
MRPARCGMVELIQIRRSGLSLQCTVLYTYGACSVSVRRRVPHLVLLDGLLPTKSSASRAFLPELVVG